MINDIPCCLFSKLSTTDRPCWGALLLYGDAPEGDGFYSCQGHFRCRVAYDDDDNRRLYKCE